jgi:hypothetical protein
MPSGTCCVDCCDRKIEKIIVKWGFGVIANTHEEVIGKSLREMDCHYFFKIGATGGFLSITTPRPYVSGCDSTARRITDLTIKFKFALADPSAMPPVPATAKFIEFASNKLLSTAELVPKATCTITRSEDLTEQTFYWSDERYFGPTKFLVNYALPTRNIVAFTNAGGCTPTDADIKSQLLSVMSGIGLLDIEITRTVLPISGVVGSSSASVGCSNLVCGTTTPSYGNPLGELYLPYSLTRSTSLTIYHLLIGLGPSANTALNHGSNSIGVSVSTAETRVDTSEIASTPITCSSTKSTMTETFHSAVSQPPQNTNLITANCCLDRSIVVTRIANPSSFRANGFPFGQPTCQSVLTPSSLSSLCSSSYRPNFQFTNGSSLNLGYEIQIVYADHSDASLCCKSPACPNRVPEDATNDSLSPPKPRTNIESDLKAAIGKVTIECDGVTWIADSKAEDTEDSAMLPATNQDNSVTQLNQGCVDTNKATVWTTQTTPGIVKRKAFVVRVGDKKEIEITPIKSIVPGGLPPVLYFNATGGTIIGRVENIRGGDVVSYSLSDDYEGLFTISPDGVISLVGSSRSLLALRGSSVPITVVATNSRSESETRVVEIQIEAATIQDADTSLDQINEMDIRTFTMPPPSTGIDLELLGATGVVWSMVNNPSGLFLINASTGVVTLTPFSNTALNADAIFGGNPYREITIRGTKTDGTVELRRIVIKLNDIDEYDAEIVSGSTTTIIPNVFGASNIDLAQEGTVVIRCRARDQDVTNSKITYSLTANPQTLFVIDSETGDISLSRDITTTSTYLSATCTIRATSQDGSFATTSLGMTFGRFDVERTDLLDEYVLPGDETDTTTRNVVDENLPAGSEVPIKVRAFNPDFPNRNYTYSFDSALGGFSDGGRFSIDSKTGQVYTETALNYERFRSHTIVVVAKADDNVTCCANVVARKASVTENVQTDTISWAATGSPRVYDGAPTSGFSPVNTSRATVTIEIDNLQTIIKRIVRQTITGITVCTRYLNGVLEFRATPQISVLLETSVTSSGYYRTVVDYVPIPPASFTPYSVNNPCAGVQCSPFPSWPVVTDFSSPSDWVPLQGIYDNVTGSFVAQSMPGFVGSVGPGVLSFGPLSDLIPFPRPGFGQGRLTETCNLPGLNTSTRTISWIVKIDRESP